MKKILFLTLIVLLLSACIPSQQQVEEILSSAEQTALAQVTFVPVTYTPNVDTIVAQTLAALTVQAALTQPANAPTLNPMFTSTPAPMGGIAGQVGQGAMKIGAFPVGSDAVYRLELPSGQTAYQLEGLPPGQYHVLAFATPGMAAPFPISYTQYVVCGMGANCTDHSLAVVTVTAGKVTANVDLLDNFGNPDLQPFVQRYFADLQGTITATPEPGSISGTLSYPSSFIPALRVVAFQVNGFNFRWVDTMENQTTYQITGLAPGLYHVVAYTMDGLFAGGYTQMVPCGLLASCTDHTLINVEVKPGQDTPSINPGDWYAPAGVFPPKP